MVQYGHHQRAIWTHIDVYAILAGLTEFVFIMPATVPISVTNQGGVVLVDAVVDQAQVVKHGVRLKIIVIWSHCKVVPSGLGVVLRFPFVLSFLKDVEPIL